SSPAPDKTTLVFDLGGGTFDITLMSIEADGGVRMLATDGDDRLGGKDWDDRLITHVAAEFEKAHGKNPLEDLTAYQDLAGKCEEAKIALSRKERVRIAASHGGLFHAVEVTRGAFEEMTADLVARLEAKVGIVLEDAGVAWREVGLVLLVGGATRMPMVRRMLERVARGVEVAEAASPDEAVALGAAIQAELLAARRDGTEPAPIGGREGKDLAGIELGHVNAHSLGVVARVRGEFANCVLIPRNTPIPCAKRGRFQTIHDNQTRIEVIVLEGEESDPESCATIGTCVISGLPARPRGSPVTIEYSYDGRGRIHVRALDLESGREATTTIERPAGLTQAGVDAAEERLAGTLVS
ncbi:MAG: Hsp70 family protein, partial [Planctomycetes bacterium]|nr:Hsp70 family protein [Planctomycetota bacterium]